MLLLGIIPAVALFAPVYLRLRARLRWAPTLLIAVALSVLVHLLLVRLLGVPAYRGWLAARVVGP
jgi:hypothetical protein